MFINNTIVSLVFGVVKAAITVYMSPLSRLFLNNFTFNTIFVTASPIASTHARANGCVCKFLMKTVTVVVHTLGPNCPRNVVLTVLLVGMFTPLVSCCMIRTGVGHELGHMVGWDGGRCNGVWVWDV